jgi:hypothetical protein
MVDDLHGQLAGVPGGPQHQDALSDRKSMRRRRATQEDIAGFIAAEPWRSVQLPADHLGRVDCR